MTTSIAVSTISAQAVGLASRRIGLLLNNRWRGARSGFALARESAAGGDRCAMHDFRSLLGFTCMLEAIADDSGLGHLGLEMACLDQAQESGIFKSLSAHAATFGQAVEDLVRFFPLIQTGTSVRLEREGRSARFIYNIQDPCVSSRLQDSAYTLGKLSQRFRVAAGEAWQLDGVTMTMGAPCMSHKYSEFFQAPVTFGGRVTALHFPASVLATPNRGGDCGRYAKLCEELETRLKSTSDSTPLEDAIRAWMKHANRRSIDGSLEQAAADFGVTPRTLQRRLKERGIGFMELRAQVRMDDARRMLADSPLSVTSIAQQLGFSESSAFTRAFTHHARQSPRAFRQASVSMS